MPSCVWCGQMKADAITALAQHIPCAGGAELLPAVTATFVVGFTQQLLFVKSQTQLDGRNLFIVRFRKTFLCSWWLLVFCFLFFCK